MAEQYGSSASVQWVYTGGTATLNTNYRQVQFNPSVDLLDVTAGADPAKKYLAAQVDAQLVLSGLMDTGGSIGSIAGTILSLGAEGTIIYGPEGTASGKPKKTFAAICLGVQENVQYNAPTEFSVTFQGNSAVTAATF